MTKKCSVSAPEEIWKIADNIAARLDISRSEVIQHLIIYAGIVGGDFPLTREILARPKKDRDLLLKEVHRRSKDNDPAKPQSFLKAVREAAADNSDLATKKAVISLLDSILD